MLHFCLIHSKYPCRSRHQKDDFQFASPTPLLGTPSLGPLGQGCLPGPHSECWCWIVSCNCAELSLPFAWLPRERDSIRHLHSGQDRCAIRILGSWLHCSSSWLWKCLMSSSISVLSGPAKSSWEVFWMPAPSGHSPSHSDLFHYLPADTEWVSLWMAVNYSGHYMQPGWLFWKDSLLCAAKGRFTETR